MKTMNKVIIAVVALGCAVSVTDLQAMRKRKIIGNNNQPNNRPKVETEDEKMITTQCSVILEGIKSKKITQTLFNQAILEIAVALKKLQEDKPTVCIKVTDVIEAFCKYLLESIQNVKEKQPKIKEIKIQLIGEEKNEDFNENQEGDDKSDQDYNNNLQDPYFCGEYTNKPTMFDLLQKLFNLLFKNIQTQQKRQELQRARLKNQEVKNQIKEKREELQKTINEGYELQEELDLQLENVQQEIHENQQLVEKYSDLNQGALQDNDQIKQLLHEEQINEDN